jgi:hypothetical protein
LQSAKKNFFYPISSWPKDQWKRGGSGGQEADLLVRGTWIHIFLFVATMAALMFLLVAEGGIVGLTLMFFIQVCVFWTLGKIWTLLVRLTYSIVENCD